MGAQEESFLIEKYIYTYKFNELDEDTITRIEEDLEKGATVFLEMENGTKKKIEI